MRRRQRASRVLAVSSGGGHWVQLLRLRPAFHGYDVTYVTVSRAYEDDVPRERLHTVRDATRWNKLDLIVMSMQLAVILLRERPAAIVTTGAAPGFVAARLGRLLGARTIWIDSIANCDELSGAAMRAGRHVDAWLTQWPSLAKPGGPEYWGSVL